VNRGNASDILVLLLLLAVGECARTCRYSSNQHSEHQSNIRSITHLYKAFHAMYCP
jgi:hypothetical protein